MPFVAHSIDSNRVPDDALAMSSHVGSKTRVVNRDTRYAGLTERIPSLMLRPAVCR